MNNPRLEVICIGTELLNGKVNTHVAQLGQELAEIGLRITREHTVGDDPAVMKEVFQDAWRRAEIIFACGGLGPTFDDITREVWSDVTGRRLKRHKVLVDEIQAKFRARGIRMPPMNRRQGDVLTGAEVLTNINGTAPGQFLQVGRKNLVLFPGPARELFPMFRQFVKPRLQKIFPGRISEQKVFQLVGIPESTVDAWIRPIVNRYGRLYGCRVVHGILASRSIISVKFTVEGRDATKVQAAVQFLTAKFRRRLRHFVFGENTDSLEGVIGSFLMRRKQTLAIAESCTGGLVSKIITDQPGASDYFLEAVVTYSNASKVRRLGVRRKTLENKGAVSAEVAREMAVGIKKKASSDFGISVTGVAGPTGGTAEKPVGLVFIGCAGPRRVKIKRFQFLGDRSWIRERAALMALDLLRHELLRDLANRGR